ncbi:hypothetical protein J2X09_001899 [Hydrogenophaga laconesensis]|uniref:Uncharacterized protein n=1 Tax=Hydrogenophaga laconesensis TaxID=1805971 RepID=A0ABU1V9M6_9BURK|nr:hypothetical protein [Hydrogenophaga laconesensis]
MKPDPIDLALQHIQHRCRVSWSENEIIALIETVRQMRKQESSKSVELKVVDLTRVDPGMNERWG